MKKLLASFLGLALLASIASAAYVTSDTAQWELVGSTEIVTGSTTTSGYVQTAGVENVMFTAGTDSANISAEVQYYLGSTATIVSTESIVLGTAKPMKSKRVKFKIYNSSAGAVTPEVIMYCY